MTGGVMQPISQAIMLEAFPPHERGKAMALFGIGIVVAPVIGPVRGDGPPTPIPGAGFSTSTSRSARFPCS
jgi:MFS family permease